MQRVPNGDAYDPQTKGTHRYTFGKCSHRAIAQRHSHHEQADCVVGGIAQKVECIGLQRGRSRSEAGADLDCKHCSVDGEYDPKNPPVCDLACRVAARIVVVMMFAAVCTHDCILGAENADMIVWTL